VTSHERSLTHCFQIESVKVLGESVVTVDLHCSFSSGGGLRDRLSAPSSPPCFGRGLGGNAASFEFVDKLDN